MFMGLDRSVLSHGFLFGFEFMNYLALVFSVAMNSCVSAPTFFNTQFRLPQKILKPELEWMSALVDPAPLSIFHFPQDNK